MGSPMFCLLPSVLAGYGMSNKRLLSAMTSRNVITFANLTINRRTALVQISPFPVLM